MGWISNTILTDLGFTEDQVAEIAQAKNDLLHIAATFKALNPRFARVGQTIEMVLEVLNRSD